MSDEPGRRRSWPRLRPGAELLDVSEDKLHIAFSNYTVTFTTPAVTKGVKALLDAMEHNAERDELVARAANETGLEPGMVSYVLEMLAASHCLYWCESGEEIRERDNPLSDYFASIGESPSAVREALATARPFVLTSQIGHRTLVDALSASGIGADIVPLPPGTPVGAIAAKMTNHLDGTRRLAVSWDIPYRSPAARMINETAMSGIPVLFGACEGTIGRIGPYVIPKSSPCLECLNSRLLTHGGAEELSCFSTYRLRHRHAVPRPRPTHPVFLSALTGFFVLELVQILLNRPPRTLGGVIEYALVDGSVTRRSLVKVPRCAACRTARPPRFAWNATFASPSIKGDSK